MPEIECFMLEKTNRCRRYLRRYSYVASEGQCPLAPGGLGHNAEVQIEDGPLDLSERGTYPAQGKADDGEERWPTQCACGYVFSDRDDQMVRNSLIYRRADTGEETTLEEAPPGAMYYCDWMSEGREYKGPGGYVGPDGRCLEVKLPDGHLWCVDGPANNGPGWERTGTPPKVTARPSILSHTNGGYHGFLTDGALREA